MPQTMVYGYFCFRLSVAKSRPVVAAVGRDAICPNCRWLRWLWLVGIAGARELGGVADEG